MNTQKPSGPAVDKTTQTDAHWRETLSPEEFAVARLKHTERPFTGRYWDAREPGIYRCVCCGTPLFASDTKFDAGCGWPSYFEAINPDHVRKERSEEHTSELQSLMRISYDVFCFKNKIQQHTT